MKEKIESSWNLFTGQKPSGFFCFFLFFAKPRFCWFFVAYQKLTNRIEPMLLCSQLCINELSTGFLQCDEGKCLLLFCKHAVVWRPKQNLVFGRNVFPKPTIGVIKGMSKSGFVNFLVKWNWFDSSLSFWKKINKLWHWADCFFVFVASNVTTLVNKRKHPLVLSM